MQRFRAELAKSTQTLVQTRQASSFSAIHNGLRATPRSAGGGGRFGDRRSGRHNTNDRWTTEKRSRGGMGLREQMTDSDIRNAIGGKSSEKGKEEEEDNDSGRMTRRKRFNMGISEHGKMSLVFAMKNGPLKDMADEVAAKRKLEADAAKWKALGREDKLAASGTRGSAGAEFNHPKKFGNDRPPRFSNGRSDFGKGDKSSRFGGDIEGKFGDNRPSKFGGDRPSSLGEQPRTKEGERPTRETGVSTKVPTVGPPIVPFTTAASQFLFGKSVVRSALSAGRRQFYKLYIYDGENRTSPDDGQIVSLANALKIPITRVAEDGQPLMDRMSQGRPHNGYILEASSLPIPPVLSLGAVSRNPWDQTFRISPGFQTAEQSSINGTQNIVVYDSPIGQKPLVIFLHRVVDPGNVGAIIRTARYMGAAAVAITNQGSSGVTPIVLKSSTGAAEEITIMTVEDSTSFLHKSRKAGWKVLTTAPPNEKAVRPPLSPDALYEDNPLARHPCILVLGSEGVGLPRPLRRMGDIEVTIPGHSIKGSSVDSLNVSVAAGLICRSLLAKRKTPAVTETKAGTATETKAVDDLQNAVENEATAENVDDAEETEQEKLF